MNRRLLWSVLGLTGLGLVVLRSQHAVAPKSMPRAMLSLANTEQVRPKSTVTMATTVAPGAAPEAIAKGFRSDQLGLPRWAPRPAEEWQGMLVDLNITPPCGSSIDCGLARACLQRKCMPCEMDRQCSTGEVCVLQHCLQYELVGCRHSAECGGDSKCILSDYSAQPRGNEGMRSACVNPRSGAAIGPTPENGPHWREGPGTPQSYTSRTSEDLLRASRAQQQL